MGRSKIFAILLILVIGFAIGATICHDHDDLAEVDHDCPLCSADSVLHSTLQTSAPHPVVAPRLIEIRCPLAKPTFVKTILISGKFSHSPPCSILS